MGTFSGECEAPPYDHTKSMNVNNKYKKIEFTKPKRQTKKKRKWTAERKKKNRIVYRRKQAQKKEEKISAIVKKIKDENVVVNLSQQVLPKSAYIFLAKGLGFVPTRKIDIQDLRYDTNEFIRKLTWKAFFKANPELAISNQQAPSIHQDIKVSSFTSPAFSHPLLDNIKTKLFGWIANHVPSNPKSNLTILEVQGKKWLTTKIKERKLFVSKADKGGATLILNYEDVQNSIKNELNNNNKFTKVERSAEDQLNHVREEVKSLCIHLEQKKKISS